MCKVLIASHFKRNCDNAGIHKLKSMLVWDKKRLMRSKDLNQQLLRLLSQVFVLTGDKGIVILPICTKSVKFGDTVIE